MKKLLAAFIAIFLVTGCATPYQPKGFAGGYTESRRGDIQFVWFEGNDNTRLPQVEQMALLRAAEIGKERGFKFLNVVSENSRVDQSEVYMPGQFRTVGSVNSFGNFQSTTQQVGGGVFSSSTPSAKIAVVYSNEKIAGNINSIDIQATIDDLGPKYIKK